MSNITIEQVGVASLTQLHELHNLSHKIDPWDYERFEQIIEHELPILAVKIDDIIIGFVIYLICLDEARIINLVIHPSYRNQGYAKQLLRYMLRDAQNNNLRYAILDVRVSNISALRLYTQLGFRVLCVRTSFYNHNEHIEDAYMMQIELDLL